MVPDEKPHLADEGDRNRKTSEGDYFMKVLLIMPPFVRLMGVRLSYFPLGLGYLAASLKERGIDARIYNTENPARKEDLAIVSNRVLFSQYNNYIRSLKEDNHIVWQEARNILKELSPDIVGLSVTTAKVGSALKISSLCKKNYPDCYVIWGGPHPTIQPEQVLQYKEVDFVIRGEGEKTIVELIQTIKSHSLDFSQIKGLSYKKDGKIIHIGDIKEIACNQCNSVGVSQIFFCPSCKNSDFKLGKLIEHYDCGNITEENTYANDKCPNCKKEIEALGVDYRVMKNHYICNDCKEFFPEISTAYLCLKCENKFKLEDAKWKSSHNYKVVNI